MQKYKMHHKKKTLTNSTLTAAEEVKHIMRFVLKSPVDITSKIFLFVKIMSVVLKRLIFTFS